MEVSKSEQAGGTLSFLAVLTTWSLALFVAPTDAMQGEAYRIMYLHVPSAITAFICAFALAGAGLWSLAKKSESGLLFQKSASEVGLVYTCLTLATGSIWGRPIWGTWWTWDARLTTTLLLAILFFAFNLLYTSMSPGSARIKTCSILGVMIAIDVPIIYKSVEWWRTLHQPTSIIRTGGSTMDPDMRKILLTAILAMLVHGAFLIGARFRNLKLSDELEKRSHIQMHKT